MTDPNQRRRLLLERFFHLRTALVQIETRHQSLSEGAGLLLEGAKALLKVAFKTFNERWEETAEVSDIERREIALANLCDDHLLQLRNFTLQIIPALDGAVPANIPFELEPILTTLVKSAPLKTPLAGVVLSSGPRLNYAVASVKFDEFYKSLAIAHEKGPSRFVVFAVPRTERDSVPLHAVMFGHEIGHLLSDDRSFLEDLAWTYPKSLRQEQLPSAKLRRRKFFSDCSRNWIAEVVADVYSALSIGPAALWALTEVAGTVREFEVDSITHPALDRRFATIIAVLREQGMYESEEAATLLAPYDRFANRWKRAVSIVKSGDTEKNLMNEVRRWFQAKLPDVIRIVRELEPRPLLFDPGSWSQVVEAAATLDRGLPAGEMFSKDNALSPLEVAVLVNAAWLAKIRGLKGLGRVLGLEEDSSGSIIRTTTVLDQLLLKSFEILRFRREHPWVGPQ